MRNVSERAAASISSTDTKATNPAEAERNADLLSVFLDLRHRKVGSHVPGMKHVHLCPILHALLWLA